MFLYRIAIQSICNINNTARDNIAELEDEFNYACPPFTHELIVDTFNLIDEVLYRAPNTSFLVVIPDWMEALWYYRTNDYQGIQTII